ncbi:MAG: ribonuclease P protein component [Candidatus Omnitrophica bacterium]|nr:ribonuclease P protein component [Candidatus Omnitrophota bacterium]
MTLGQFRFETQERLAKEKDFGGVLKKGNSLRAHPFRIHYLKKEQGPSRLAVSIAKKDYKKAVERNGLKRRVREFFRRNKNRFAHPHDLIVRVAAFDWSANAGKFDALLEKLFKEAGIWKP